MPTRLLTRRDRIIQHLMARFSGLRVALGQKVTFDVTGQYTVVANDEDDPILFNRVERGDGANVLATQLPSIAIDEGDSVPVREQFPLIDYRTILYIHFKFKKEVGIAPLETFNYYLGICQSLVSCDTTCGGLAIDLRITGSTTAVSDDDPQPGGALVIEVDYRTSQVDPFE